MRCPLRDAQGAPNQGLPSPGTSSAAENWRDPAWRATQHAVRAAARVQSASLRLCALPAVPLGNQVLLKELRAAAAAAAAAAAPSGAKASDGSSSGADGSSEAGPSSSSAASAVPAESSSGGALQRDVGFTYIVKQTAQLGRSPEGLVLLEQQVGSGSGSAARAGQSWPVASASFAHGASCAWVSCCMRTSEGPVPSLFPATLRPAPAGCGTAGGAERYQGQVAGRGDRAQGDRLGGRGCARRAVRAGCGGERASCRDLQLQPLKMALPPRYFTVRT